jgi:Immunoglobulin I-set domain
LAATLVQASGLLGANQGTSVSSITFNATSAFTVGNDVIVSIAMQANNLISSVTIAGTTATKDSSRETDTFRAVYIFRARIVNSGQTSVVVNLPAADTFSIALSIDEWSGFINPAIDVAGNSTGVGVTSHTVSSASSTTQADEVVYAVAIFAANPGSTTFPSGYTTSFDDIANVYYWAAAVQKTVSATGTQSATWTSTNAVNSRLALATFKIAPPPTINSQPTGQTAKVGETATFSVSASGTGTLSYQWQRNTGSSWSNIVGATSSSYVTPTLSLTEDGYQYRVNVTDSVGTTTSNAALLDVWQYVFDPAVFDSAVFDVGTTTTGTTVYVKIGGVWKTATAFVKIGGVWKAATPGVKVSGVWKN